MRSSVTSGHDSNLSRPSDHAKGPERYSICGAASCPQSDHLNIEYNFDISFVIPAYNEEAVIRYCLNSIYKEINSGICTAEVIVVDNGSYDRTKAIALSFPGIHVVTECNRNLVAARSAGFRIASGALIANIDADTILPDGWLSNIIAEFDKTANLVGLSGPYIYYDTSLLVRTCVATFYGFAFVAHCFAKHVLRIGAVMQGGNFVVRANALHAIGGFNSRFRFYGEDTELACRLSKIGGVKFARSAMALSSGRRFAGEGLFRVGTRYAANFLWAMFRGRPFTDEWKNFRPEPKINLAAIHTARRKRLL